VNILVFLGKLLASFAIVGVVAIPVAAGPLAHAVAPVPEPVPGCQAGQWPEFHYGFEALHLDLGDDMMGDPVECEHAINATGDTQQRTTRGLAFYDHAANRPAFRLDEDNWALTVRGLEYWSGDATEPPVWAVAIPSAGSARLSAIAVLNSGPGLQTVIGVAAAPTPALSRGAGSFVLTHAQVAPVVDELGVSEAEPITVDMVAKAIQSSGSAVAEVTRGINMASKP
jgi:hypothetical protein